MTEDHKKIILPRREYAGGYCEYHGWRRDNQRFHPERTEREKVIVTRESYTSLGILSGDRQIIQKKPSV